MGDTVSGYGGHLRRAQATQAATSDGMNLRKTHFIALPPIYFTLIGENNGRSQWPRGLRHELSSLVPTLGSWGRMTLKAWVSVL
jgi:hypothetical protein